MKNQNLTIGFLSLTALVLFVAQFIPVQPAYGTEAVKDRTYSLVTAKSQQGGEVVYVIDNRSGGVAVFSWDVGRRSLQLRGVDALAGAFR